MPVEEKHITVEHKVKIDVDLFTLAAAIVCAIILSGGGAALARYFGFH